MIFRTSVFALVLTLVLIGVALIAQPQPNLNYGIYQNQLRGFPRIGVFVTDSRGQVRQANVGEGLRLDFTNPADPVLSSPLPPPPPASSLPPTATVITVTQPESAYPLPSLSKACLVFRNGVLLANSVNYVLESSTLRFLPDPQGDNSTKPGDVLQFVCW